MTVTIDYYIIIKRLISLNSAYLFYYLINIYILSLFLGSERREPLPNEPVEDIKVIPELKKGGRHPGNCSYKTEEHYFM